MNFINDFENKILETIKQHKLLTKRDKILVAYSGGKDSGTLLYILKKYGFDVEALHINLHIKNFSEFCYEAVKKFCEKYNVKLYVVDFRKEFGGSICFLHESLSRKGIKLKKCTLCGILRRNVINSIARKHGFTKVATGHNLDDEAQTFLMNLFKGNIWLSSKLGPKVGVIQHKNFVPRVKPLYFCKEKEIEKYAKAINFPCYFAVCPCAAFAYRRFLINLLKKYNFNLENVVNFFLEIMPLLRKNIKGKLYSCKICGEPSAKPICNFCQIIAKIK